MKRKKLSEEVRLHHLDKILRDAFSNNPQTLPQKELCMPDGHGGYYPQELRHSMNIQDAYFLDSETTKFVRNMNEEEKERIEHELLSIAFHYLWHWSEFKSQHRKPQQKRNEVAA